MSVPKLLQKKGNTKHEYFLIEIRLTLIYFLNTRQIFHEMEYKRIIYLCNLI